MHSTGSLEKLWHLLDREQIINKSNLEKMLAHHLEYTVGKHRNNTTVSDIYKALAYSVRDILIDRSNETQAAYRKNNPKRVYYLSLEFLMGRTLMNAIMNLGIYNIVQEVISDFGLDLHEIEECEHDAGLGNGGLGRLAACFMDSLATLNLPGYGYGLRYEYGIFNQLIEDGSQIERPDQWLSNGNPWEFPRPEASYPVNFYGHVERTVSPAGRVVWNWKPSEVILAVAHDTPIPGFNTNTVNNLRLWVAKSSEEFNFDYFNHGDYLKAVEDKQKSENISKVLYPNDKTEQGKILRLKQQYLMASASLQDIIHRYKRHNPNFDRFTEEVAIQLNDTHPSIAIPELMRIFLDQENMDWDKAWDICKKVFAYTNHTVLPEALEVWNVGLIEHLLPRHMQIIYDINYFFMDEARRSGKFSEWELGKMSIIQEGESKNVRMANLSVIGSHSVNGVAALHTELLKSLVFPEFYNYEPWKFNNKTNGITQRRFLVQSNPELSTLIGSKLGEKFITDLDSLQNLKKFADDKDFQASWQKVKHGNKVNLAKIIKDSTGVVVDTNSIFDVQVKRFHEYKRQLLNILHVVGLYTRIQREPGMNLTPRTFIFGGKAAPGYYMAKLIIRFINAVANVVNNDKKVDGRIKVVFLPNYRVSLAEKIFPASDVSEQISTAGTEASGTGNMKFALNGALTIGTLDGANIEIMEEVGTDNIYIFGLKTEEVQSWKKTGYSPSQIIGAHAELGRIFTLIKENFFSPNSRDLFNPIHDSLFYDDVYMLIADYQSYADTQAKIGKDYADKGGWTKKSIMNVAGMGKFSSDRTIRQYADEIWKVKQQTPAETKYKFKLMK